MQKHTYNLILGVNQDSEPIIWHWDNENALAIIGKGGSGKTTNSAYWLSQWACQGVRLLMADPHMNNRQSLYVATEHLHDALVEPCACDYGDITRYIELFHQIGYERLNNTGDHYPLVFVIDEFTSYLLNSSDTKASALKLLDSVNQYRKVGLRLMLIGQSWGQAIRVASQLRDSISSAVVLKSSKNDAAKFCAFDTTAKEANLLPIGRGFYQDEMIWIPKLTGTGKLVAQKRVKAFMKTDTLHRNEIYLHDMGT
nr:hypothetical protein [Oscillochloris trichoides]